MEHLNRETLARLVDESPEDREAQHLAACHTCATELDALRAQTRALASLPEIRPPLGDWQVLEARLRSEGLIEDAGTFAHSGLARTPGWMRAAAALAIFLGGTAMGAGLAARDQGVQPLALDSNLSSFASAENVEDAAAAVEAAEQGYVAALTRYRQLIEADPPTLTLPNRLRFASAETLDAFTLELTEQLQRLVWKYHGETSGTPYRFVLSAYPVSPETVERESVPGTELEEPR